ncbi:AsnC family transcriptional regulator [Flavobacterium branchiophilum NBRC 15030 = ATCC 35035]|uniref:AsnC family transcriptional regulator n=2 Tax=Flavobacterium branchiophilum TaxID=55197 RepID=A0A2H3L108_9FLAO|nr:Lrp/AsnC family transcriptional regulator [Flavobacterium branchiophilum]OXA77796.1 AsnC family transcriptional regulator [Flavobacterium branchiophilum NBRC 15030 = ATCC 35035]PDS26350.1 Lrp/AsnC family transcriptional regulator [Flavobacterium branchiophilum]TQM40044.1 AsnC family transcriptional regulator [Flavobacterium branchiophilum]CCB70692.1 Probable transcriptional regulator, AsnC family [Flavobacterium branchiophilum FL-15]GEM56009.1 AsnC family transcriptional regulator [Flavobac
MIFDEIDKKILQLLQDNAQLTLKDIASKINLSLSPVHDRVKKLEKEGVIEKYVAILNKKKTGKNLVVYCQVTLVRQTIDVAESFNKAIMSLPEVVECHFVSGSFDYMLKIILPDMETYHHFHQKKLSVLTGVSQIHTFFAMAEVKSTTKIPL